MPASVYFGDEPFLLEQAVRALRARVVSPAMAALSYRKLEKPSLTETLEAVGAPSLCLGGDSLLEIRHFAPLEKALDPDADADKAQLDALMTLLGNLAPSRHILFVSPKIDRKVKFAKWLTSQADCDAQEFKSFAFWEVDKAISTLLRVMRDREIALSSEAARLLVEQLGVSLQPLINEAEKLAVYARGRAITPQDVRALCDHNENTFRMLSDWLLDRPRGPIFATLEQVLLRTDPTRLFGQLQTQLHHVYCLRALQQKGMGKDAIAGRLKKHPFRVQKDLEQYARASLPRLSALKDRALDLEWRAKTGQLDPHLSLELLLGA